MKSLIFQPEEAAWLHEIGRDAQTRRVIKPQPIERGCIEVTEWGFSAMTPFSQVEYRGYWMEGHEKHFGAWFVKCPFKVGERRYVKEPWRPYQGVHKEIIEYRGADQFMVVPRELNAHPYLDLNCEWTILHDKGNHWRNPLFMPEWAARTIVEITSVGVAKVCEISEADAVLEGMEPQGERVACWSFRTWLDPARTRFGSGSCCGVEPPPEECVVGYGRFDIRQNGWTEPATAADKFREHWDSIHGNGAPWESTWVWVVGLRTVETR